MNLGDFHGRETIILANEYFQLECLADAGPRIVRFTPAWLGENIFAEVQEFGTTSTSGEFYYFGGHRLWTAPESFARTYIPDDSGLTAKKTINGLKLVGRLEPDTNLRKSLSIQLSPNRPFVMIKHKIENLGRVTLRLARWAVTMLRPKSTAILPQQFGTVDKESVLPNRNVALWSYSRWDDPRLKLGEEFIKIESNELRQPFKLGYFNPHGWLGYWFEDVFFVKRFGVRRDEEFPDFGCNSEVYTNERYIELASVGALVDLKPREDVVYTETWEVYETTKIPAELFGEKSLEAILRSEP